MDNVNTIRDDELKELSFQMMLIEGRKLQEENRKCFSKRLREEGKGGIYTAKEEKERYYMDLLRLDAEGYDLSLKYNDRLQLWFETSQHHLPYYLEEQETKDSSLGRICPLYRSSERPRTLVLQQ